MRKAFTYHKRDLNDFIYEVGSADRNELDGILAILRPNWHHIYQRTLPPEALDPFIEQTVRPHYSSIIDGKRSDRHILTAHTKSGILCGFTCYGLKDGAHEIQAIYVAPDHVNRSIGAMMILSASDQMMKQDRKNNVVMPVRIRICTDNEGATLFASKLEGTIQNAEEREFLGATITDQIIGWHSAQALNNCLRRKFSNALNQVPDKVHGGREIFPAHP